MRKALSVLFLLVLGFCSATAEAKRPKDSDKRIVHGEVGRKIEAAIEAAAPDLWGSVLVAKGGKILLAKGYGKADYGGTPNTPRTLHEIASASKQVTGAAVLHLVQRRKLELDATLGSIFKRVPDDKKRITVHQLLTHTSGISGNTGVSYASPLDTKAYIRTILASPLATEPGTKFEYSNAGYAILAAIVTTISKRDFEDYVERYLFKPAKCVDSGFIKDKDLMKSGRASVRREEREPRYPNATAVDWHWGYGYRGMGGVVTTVYDLLRWDRALRGKDILKDETKALLYTPEKNFYACGWHVAVTDRGTRKAHHSGSVAGYGCNVVRYLEDDVCIFALSNSGESAYKVTAAVEKILFAPVALKVEIDARAYGAGGREVRLPTQLAWDVGRKKGMLLLRLMDGKEAVLEVELPKKTYGRKLLFESQQAAASRASNDPGEGPSFEAVLHLGGYGPSPRIRHGFGSVEIRAEERGRDAAGKPTLDERAALLLKDTRSGGRTATIKMNAAAVRELHEALKKVVK